MESPTDPFGDDALNAMADLTEAKRQGHETAKAAIREFLEFPADNLIEAFRQPGAGTTVRSFGAAWEKAAGPIARANSGLGRVVGFLGPTGTIGLAAAGTTVAVGLLWNAFADDADAAIARTEKRVEDLRKATARIGEQRRIASESADRLSAIRSDREKLGSISERLGGIGWHVERPRPCRVRIHRHLHQQGRADPQEGASDGQEAVRGSEGVFGQLVHSGLGAVGDSRPRL